MGANLFVVAVSKIRRIFDTAPAFGSPTKYLRTNITACAGHVGMCMELFWWIFAQILDFEERKLEFSKENPTISSKS